MANRGLQTTITLYRRRPPQENPYGTDEESWETEGTTMLAWVREMGTSQIREYNGMAAEIGDYRIHMDAEVECLTGDRIVMNGETYEVQDTNTQNTYRVFTTAIARRRQP